MRNASPQNESGAVFTLRARRDLLDAIREIGAREHRTLSQELRHMMESRVAEEKAADGNGADELSEARP